MWYSAGSFAALPRSGSLRIDMHHPFQTTVVSSLTLQVSFETNTLWIFGDPSTTAQTHIAP
jgi:hypothetical protein